MDRAAIEGLGFVRGSIVEIVCRDVTRYVGFYLDTNDTHVRLSQTWGGRLHGFLNIPMNEINEIWCDELHLAITRTPA